MRKEAKPTRNKNIRRAIKAGSSYRQIGKRYKVSGKRVFEIVNKTNKRKSKKK